MFRSPAQDAVSIDWALPAYTGVPYEYRALLYDANGVAARSYVIEILQ